MHKQEVPQAEKIPHSLQANGETRMDPYFWLKERENPKVKKYLEEENAYTEEKMGGWKDLEGQLFFEMKSRMKEDDSSVPVIKKEYKYWLRYIAGGQYPIYVRQKLSSTAEEVLLDGNKMAEGLPYFQSTSPIMSPDQKTMAYGVDSEGRRFYHFKFRNLETSQDLKVELPRVTANLVWAADNVHVFYAQQNPETLRSEKIFRLNTLTGQNQLVYEEKDETFNVHVYQSLAKKFIFIYSGSTLTTEARYLPSDQPLGEWKVFFPRQREHEYEVQDGGDRFYIVSNWKAKNFRIFETDLKSTDRSAWKEIIPHRTETLITDLVVFKNYLVVSERTKGLDQIHVLQRDTLKGNYIPFQDQTYTASVHSNVEYDSQLVRYDFESMRWPETTFDYNMGKKTSQKLKTKEVPNYNPNLYRTERVWIKARDGVMVPVSLLMKKETQKNAKNALLVYGYGSYGNSSDPYFRQSIISLVDRNFIYAIAHIRGGSELGREWYEQGRVLNKKNTFNDFIDVTESLVKDKWADPQRVYAYGGSAGGLLMGVVINEKPQLYRGVVAGVPFVDVVTTMLDDSIPLTTGEYDEWGNPHEKKYYDYILGYSPYDNVKPQSYPNLLVTTGFHDSQVQYWEPAKWVAKLRDNNQGSNMILLKTNMNAGHGGASGRYEFLKEMATDFAFFVGLDQKVIR